MVAGKSKSLPILDDLLFMNNKITASDLINYFEVPFEFEGKFTVSAAALKKIVDSMEPTDDIAFDCNEETYEVFISINGALCYKIAGDNPIDYPKTPEVISYGNQFLFKYAKNRDIFSELLPFCGDDDDLRPAMTGVGIKDQFACATDGQRLVLRAIDHEPFPLTRLKVNSESKEERNAK